MHIRDGGLWKGRAFATLLALVASLPLTSCLLPVQHAPAVEGVVVDQASGEPLAGALVVVRFDTYFDGALPDRQHLGHIEATTDESGGFRAGPLVVPGVAPWPLFRTEARVVSVMYEGYRCASPEPVREAEPVRVELSPALDPIERRSSCRPIAAKRGEAESYMQEWRNLHPEEPRPASVALERQLDRLLAARSIFGFGENCQGPVMDLALAPGGRRAAFLVAGDEGYEVRMVHLGSADPKASLVGRIPAGPDAPDEPTQRPVGRLAWSGPDELLLWEPTSDLKRAISPSGFAAEHLEVVWSEQSATTPPASPGFDADAPGRLARSGPAGRARPRRPIEPADLSDAGDALWLGRSFALGRRLDPNTGLPLDELRVLRENGTRYSIPLPGEACGPEGRFGRPQYRIAADGRTALDLRYVEDGCHALRIDLETGRFKRLDRAAEPAACRVSRNVPAAHFGVALRGYERELKAAVTAAGADPAAAYALFIAPGAQSAVNTRTFAGQALQVRVPSFPLATPLRRIDVSLVGAARVRPAGPVEVRAATPL